MKKNLLTVDVNPESVVRVLGFCVRNQSELKVREVLLARKAPDHHFFPNCLNGYGGGVKKVDYRSNKRRFKNHSVPYYLLNCLGREFNEESAIKIDPWSVEQVALLTNHTLDTKGQIVSTQIVFVFIIGQWEGIPQSTVEMINPNWYSVSSLPFAEMMPSDTFWLNDVLFESIKIKVEVTYLLYTRACVSEPTVTFVEGFSY